MTEPDEPQAQPTQPEQAAQEEAIQQPPAPPRIGPDWITKGGWPKGAEKRGDEGET